MKVYTPEEVGQILSISRRTIYSYIKSGDLKAAFISNRWRITEEQLTEFLAKKTAGAGDIAEARRQQLKDIYQSKRSTSAKKH